MNCEELIYSVLKAHGVNTIYGIVGREAEFISFNTNAIDFILTHDERSASVMADMHGRLTGNVGVCYSTFGPGATNLVTGVASAFSDRSPVLAISAQVAHDHIHPSTHQYIDQVAMMRPITKYAKEITDPSELEYELEKALLIATQDMPGPCFLSVPYTFFQQECPSNKQRAYAFEKDIDVRKIAYDAVSNEPETFQALWQQSQYPLVIVGPGLKSKEEYDVLSRFLAARNVPFFVTYSAKAAMPAAHPCYLGTISGYIDHIMPTLCGDLFSQFDLVMGIGFDMVEGWPFDLFRNINKTTMCLVNSNIETNGLFPVDYVYSVSLKSFLDDLITRDLTVEGKHCSIDDLREILNKAKKKMLHKGEPMCAARIVHDVQKVLSPSDIVISDVGLHKQYFAILYDAFAEKRYYCSNGLGAMGFGLPAAIAAKKALPDNLVVLVCGDGGFHISSAELETAVRYDLPIVILLFCDRSLGLIRHYQEKGRASGRDVITQYGHIDFCQLAEANGCNGIRLSDIKELPILIKKSMCSRKPTLIEIPIEQESYV